MFNIVVMYDIKQLWIKLSRRPLSQREMVFPDIRPITYSTESFYRDVKFFQTAE